MTAAPDPSGGTASRQRLAWILGGALAALAIPSLLAPIPPLTDYPNNLARFWLLTHAVDPPMPGMFAVQWDTLTNLGTDLLSLLLAPVAGVELAARIIALLGVLIVPVGGVLLWRALHGRRHWWPIAFVLLAWSFELLDGFLNFRFGLGLALLATAYEASRPLRRVWRIALLRLVSGAVILLFHPFGFVFYGVLLFGLVLGPHPARRRWQEIGAGLLTAAVALAVPLGLYLAVSPRLPGDTGGLQTGLAEISAGFRQALARPGSKLVGVATALRSYSNLADALAVACLVLPLAAAAGAGRVRVHAGLLAGAAACLMAYLLCPSALAGADWVDRRFVCMIPLLLAASLRPELPPRPALACALLLLGGSLFRTGYVATAWRERQPDYAAVARTLSQVPPGAAVFAVEHRPAASFVPPLGRYLTVGESTFRHAVTLAIPWRRAFVPTLFAIRGQQPVRVLPPWEGLATVSGGNLVSVHALAEPDAYRAVIAKTPYLAHWRDRMDYMLVIDADLPDRDGPVELPPEMELVTDQGFAQLFRIRR